MNDLDMISFFQEAFCLGKYLATAARHRDPPINNRIPKILGEKLGSSVKASPMINLPSPINQKHTPADDSTHIMRFRAFTGDWASKAGSS
jgi:hypothetical protein